MRTRTAVVGVFGALVAIGFLATAPGAAAIVTVGPIDFNDANDYDNNASQTTGLFRDILAGQYINRGNDTFSGDAGTFTALNFNDGVNNQTGGITMNDTSPATSAATKFGGEVSIRADVITYEATNGAESNLVAWYDYTNDLGIALVMRFSGGTKGFYLSTFRRDNSNPATLAGANNNMNSVSGFAEEKWLRVEMDLSLSGSTLSITGKVYAHATNDPTSAVGSQLGTTLTYSGSITSGTLAPIEEFGEIGMAFDSASNKSKASITNFYFTGNDGTPVAVAGGAYSVPFNGSTDLAGSTGTGSYGSISAWEWDLNLDGTYDVVGQNPNVTHAYLTGLGMGMGVHTIRLRTTNNVGLTDTDETELTIVPEPASAAVVLLGFIGVLVRRRRR